MDIYCHYQIPYHFSVNHFPSFVQFGSQIHYWPLVFATSVLVFLMPPTIAVLSPFTSITAIPRDLKGT